MAVNDTVESVLNCVICTDELREPKTLPCSHSFCRRCLAMLVTSKYMTNDGSLQAPSMTISIVCPTCNTRSQEFRSLDDMRTLHIINKLLEAQVKDRGETQKESLCFICKKSAKICCYRCNDCFCPDCYKMAKVQPCPVANAELAEFMQGVVIKHALVSIAVPLEDHCDCAEHSLPLNLFCSDCKQIICIDCFLLSHKNHKTKLVKHGREEALTHIEKIKVIREINAERYRDLHQAAKYESAGALDDEQRIEDIEKRIHGLISSVFKKARSLHSSKYDIWRTAAEETLSFFDNSSPTCADYDFNNKTDFELVCLMSDLQLAENRVQEEATIIESKLQSIGRIKSENNLKLHINEEPIFNCILSILNHVHFGQENIVKELAYCYSFEDFSKGKYSESTEGQKDSNTPDRTLVAHRDNQYDVFTGQRQDEPMAFEEGLLDIPMLYNELEAVPERIRLFSSKLSRLYLETAALTSSDAAQRFKDLRDDTRNVEVAYQKGVLPLVQQCVSDIKNYYQFLTMEESWDDIANITTEFKAQKEACDALAVIHVQFMCKLRLLKVVVSEHMEEGRDIEDKYEEETGGLKKSSLFRLAVGAGAGAGAVVIGISGPPVAVLVGYAVVFAIAARVIAGDTTEIHKKAYDKNAVVAVIMDTLLPALDEFISALEYACGSLDVLRYELETLQVKLERANDREGLKRLQYKQMNKNPDKIMSICNSFIAILPSIHNELDDIPKLGLDDGYVDELQLMVKEVFSKHRADMKMFEVVTKSNQKESKFSKVLFASTKALLSFFRLVLKAMFVYIIFSYCYFIYRHYS